MSDLSGRPLEPHRLPMEEMEYTTLPEVMAKLTDRWRSDGGGAPTREDLLALPR